MWKDFFYFSRSQRSGIIILIVLIVVVIALNYTIPHFFPPQKTDDTAFKEEVENFKKSLQSRDSLKLLEQQSKSSIALANQKETIPLKYTFFHFDPNKADSVTFVKLGIPYDVAGRIIRYREKGGVFEVPDDFSKMYGLSAEKFNELKPYINIGKVKPLLVDLNSADTTELKKVRGIGSYYAKQIVSFRKRAGGFYSVEQLSEIQNMRAENYERMKEYCTVDLSLIEKINVNSVSLTRLKKHPYITDEQAKMIVDIRKEKRISSLGELMETGCFYDEERMRLEPYLSFE